MNRRHRYCSVPCGNRARYLRLASDPVAFCSVVGCDRWVRASGMCNPHYLRTQRHGDPFGGGPSKRSVRYASDSERVLRNIEIVDGHWLWTGTLQPEGYGRIGKAGRPIGAHRLSYETFVGPIPEGLHIDHLCRIPRCVNPVHLEPVTCAENMHRGTSPAALNARKTHCPHGHPYDEVNTRRRVDGSRACRACEAAYRARVRGKVAP